LFIALGILTLQGWGTKVLVPACRKAGFKVVSLWGRTNDKAEEFAQKLGIDFASSDYKQVISREGVDLVFIVTPPIAHYSMAREALIAGKHVVCEKPFTLSKQESLQLVEEARKRPNQLSLIDHELRFLTCTQLMKKLLNEDKVIGDVTHVDVIGHISQRGTRTWNWFHNDVNVYGGGFLGAVGSHLIDLVSWILNRKVTAVSAMLKTTTKSIGDILGTLKDVKSDDYFSLQLNFDKDVFGQFLVRRQTFGHSEHKISIFGSTGILTLNHGTLSAHSNDGRLIMSMSEPSAPPEFDDSLFTRGTCLYMEQLFRLMSSIKTGVLPSITPNAMIPNAADFEQGHYIQEVIDTARESNQQKRWVSLH